MATPSVALSDRVQRAEAHTGFDLFIYSAYEKPGWQARTAGDRIHVPHPGTAVEYEGALYEVMDIGAAEGTPYTWRYGLRKWEERFVVRQVFPYTPETARAMGAAVMEHRKQYRRHTWLIYLFPITGLLPSGVLQRWQREWGLPMRGASFGSILLVGVPSLAVGAAALRAGHRTAATVLLCLGLEQIVRFFWWLNAEEAVGSFAVSALWGIWCDLRGLEPDGTPKRRRKKEYEAERDEVRPMKEGPWELEVWSAFRVPALVGSEPVRLDQDVYEPLPYIQQGQGIYRRYVFRLKKLEPGRRALREYTPERSASQAALLARYEQVRDRAHVWALLCGFLPAARQVELEKKYDLNATAGTERSAWTLLAAAGLQLSTALGWGLGTAHFFAAYLIAESLYRLALARSRGEPVGSLFGFMLVPFLRF